MDEIRALAVEGLNRIRHGGVEIGGVLFGSHDGNRVRILKFRPLPIEYANGPNFDLSPTDEASLEKLLEDAKTDEELRHLEAVGWYRTHTRTEIALIGESLSLFNRYFPRMWQVALVLKPSSLGSANARFFYREEDGLAQAQEITLEPGPAPIPANGKIPAALKVRSQPFTEAPLNKKWLLVSVCLAAIGIALLAGRLNFAGWTTAKSSLNLKATEAGGQLRIEWDRAAEPVIGAEKGILRIQDGDRSVETALGAEMLRSGRVLYQRRSSDVEIRMRVDGPDSEVVQETMRLVGLPAVARRSLEFADRPMKANPPAVTAANIPNASVPPARPKPRMVYRGPKSGTLIWRGALPANGVLEINRNRASFGELTGRLPNAPIRITAYPAKPSRGGVTVYSPNLSRGTEVTDLPDENNGWIKTVYKHDTKHTEDILVAEAPSPRNEWKRVVLRGGKRKLSAVVIDWELR